MKGMLLLEFLTLGSGVLLISWSAFLYEGEELGIEEALGSWWVTLDDARKVSVSRNTFFLQHVATTVTRWLDSIFGARFLSFRAISASSCLSLSSLLLLRFAVRWFPFPLWWYVTNGVLAMILFFTATTRSHGLLRVLVMLLGAIAALAAVVTLPSDMQARMGELMVSDVHPIQDELSYATGSLAIAIFLGVIADFGVLVLTRFLAARAQYIERARWLILAAVVNAAIAITIAVLPLFLAIPLMHRHRWFFAMLVAAAFTNLYSSLIASSFLMLSLTLLLHRAMWPILNRSIYALHRFRFFQQRKVLFFAGSALVAIAVPGCATLLSNSLRVLFP